MNAQWYQKSYRRCLIDMHIEDWHEEFLAEFNPDTFLDYLKTAGMDAVMLKLQTHVGLCYYPTKCGVMHKAFTGKEHTMQHLVNLCHQNNIYAVGYYSLIYSNRTALLHPDWNIIDDENSYTSPFLRGESRYGYCCPNNPEYRAFIREQIAEIAEEFPSLDGMFFDQTNWPQICHCQHCQERLTRETGLTEFPDAFDFHNEASAIFRAVRYDWMADFAEYISSTAAELMPHASISHNNASAICTSWKRGVDERVGDACTYAAGDQYVSITAHSFGEKYYRAVTLNQPFEYMVTRFSRDLTQHTLTKTPRELQQITLLTVAHHGANFLVDTIDPVGTVDNRIAEIIRIAYDRQKPYEKYLRTGELVSDIGLWYSITGRYASEGQDFTSLKASYTLCETLAANHILYDVIANKNLLALQNYPFVYAPAVGGLTQEHIQAAVDYVRDGGILCFSGTEVPELLQLFFGAQLKGFTDTDSTYLAPTAEGAGVLAPFTEKYPLSLSHKHPLLSGMTEDTVILGKLTMPYQHPTDPMGFASIHSNPPGVPTNYPALMERSFGKGKVVWLGIPLEFYSDRQHKEIVAKLIRCYFDSKQQSLTTTVAKQVEIIAFRDTHEWLISAVNIADPEDRRLIPAYSVTVKTDFEPGGVYLLPEETTVPYTYADGQVTFLAREMDLFDMYRII